MPLSFFQYKKGPDLILAPQSTICSYASDLYGDFYPAFAGIPAVSSGIPPCRDGMKSVPASYNHKVFL